MDQVTELNLTIIQGTTFRQRLTVRDEGIPVPLTDRAFKGLIVAKPNGVNIAELEIVMADQATSPGEFDILVSAQKSRIFPVNETPRDFLVPTVFYHSIIVTYSSRPNEPESFAFGKVIVYPQTSA